MVNSMNTYAPVILFVYNRPNHLKKTINSLKKTDFSANTPLYIYSDGPKKESDIPPVLQVREIIGKISGFFFVKVIEREYNFGLANSIISGVTEVLERYPYVIVLEDDLDVSKNFLKYMNSALLHYQNDKNVFSITGHTFPSKYLPIDSEYGYDTYTGVRCSSWSWGTWADRWEKVDWEIKDYNIFYSDIGKQEKFNQGGPDLTPSLILQKEGKIDSWAIRFCYAHYLYDMRCIYPIKTLVRNTGLDNSGTHCGPNLKYKHPHLDNNWLPLKFCPSDEINPNISSNFYNIFLQDQLQSPIKKNGLLKKRNKIFLITRKSYRIINKFLKIFFPSKTNVDILHINTYEKNGGAARAAFRIFQGIHNLNKKTVYLTLFKESNNREVIGINEHSVRAKIAQYFRRLDLIPLRDYPDRDNSTFSPSFLANPMRFSFKNFCPKIIHLHWIGYSILRIEELKGISCPIVWTLHDQWAFTGGCHYSGDCHKYDQYCGKCPKLSSDRDCDISQKLFERKKKVYSNLNITIVTPSYWLANLARKSSLLCDKKIEVIPNGLDLNIFNPINHQAAKEYYGIPKNIPVLLFSSHSLTDPRKGADLMINALKKITIPCVLLSFGGGNLDFPHLLHIEYRPLGSPVDDLSLVMAYSAADLYLCPTREDNLPNVVAEALACGTPCVAFDVGGLSEMIEKDMNGWIAKAFDTDDFALGIQTLLLHPNPIKLREAARNKAIKEYDIKKVSKHYIDLYNELINEMNT